MQKLDHCHFRRKIFNDEVIHDLQIHTRSLKGLSLLEQHKGLFGNMTAEENLYAILELHIKDKEEINDRIDALLGYFELGYLKKSKELTYWAELDLNQRKLC